MHTIVSSTLDGQVYDIDVGRLWYSFETSSTGVAYMNYLSAYYYITNQGTVKKWYRKGRRIKTRFEGDLTREKMA